MKKGSILIVDDDTYSLQMIEFIVDLVGVSARYTPNDEEAVGILKKGCFPTVGSRNFK